MKNLEFKGKFFTFMSNLTPEKQTQIKETIGDSTNNNRVVTVSQVIRYLTRKNASTAQRRLGINIRIRYNTDQLKIRRDMNWSNRTDAFDINEFLGLVEVVSYCV